MALGRRLFLLARSLARRAPRRVPRTRLVGNDPTKGKQLGTDKVTIEEDEFLIPKLENKNATLQYQTCIRQKLHQKDLQISKMEKKVDMLKNKVEKEIDLYKSEQEKLQETLKISTGDVKFSFIRGAITALGVAAAGASLLLNITRLMPLVKGVFCTKSSASVGPTDGKIHEEH